MKNNQTPDESCILDLLTLIHDRKLSITGISDDKGGEQGFSGSQICYHTVTSKDDSGNLFSDTIVTKSAVLFERRVVNLLKQKDCIAYPLIVSDLVSDVRKLLYMPRLDALPARDHGHYENPVTLSVADSLAKIHAANRMKLPPFMKSTSDDYQSYLWLHAWRKQWEQNLADKEFADEFSACTGALEKAMDRFIGILQSLSEEGDSLTVLNVDLHPDHIRLWRDRACFIDWEQSSFGTLYLDLPNYFKIETVLSYRDALAAYGYEIPLPVFLERFNEVGRYMGLRYLGFSLWQWAQGGETRRQGRWFLYYTLHLALHGR